MMNFEEFLNEGTLYATSKDGVRKKVRNNDEALAWKDTIAKPPKAPRQSPAKKETVDYVWLAKEVMAEVSRFWPDNDGFEQISKSLVRKYPHIIDWDARKHIDKACKLHLNVKDFDDYVDQMAN